RIWHCIFVFSSDNWDNYWINLFLSIFSFHYAERKFWFYYKGNGRIMYMNKATWKDYLIGASFLLLIGIIFCAIIAFIYFLAILLW
ncbi:MAG: hypothetical protein K2O22_01805, partial [Anaeroplasmataceae bacterium]|nr:hypothetical protein [Anaeroplasmataceae bacterium]